MIICPTFYIQIRLQPKLTLIYFYTQKCTNSIPLFYQVAIFMIIEPKKNKMKAIIGRTPITNVLKQIIESASQKGKFSQRKQSIDTIFSDDDPRYIIA
ncbi:UNKNOWN [Stylonychia lemnae]|uniref:Uncharacterized protein n=1 Tax=Stylonychia lemnae TaxID=5949 RepID=A0A078BAD4_STYLE|nr:UNKNOWN [Stylonychia lemnae]|eukprot:CDW90222.1 UNKNOWN [Stylonychia lemnae]